MRSDLGVAILYSNRGAAIEAIQAGSQQGAYRPKPQAQPQARTASPVYRLTDVENPIDPIPGKANRSSTGPRFDGPVSLRRTQDGAPGVSGLSDRGSGVMPGGGTASPLFGRLLEPRRASWVRPRPPGHCPSADLALHRGGLHLNSELGLRVELSGGRR